MSNFSVHLDPGHYGSKYNQSTTNKKYFESKMTWTLAGYLKTELESYGITVTMSRKNIDENPALYDRGYGAKNKNLFLSLHSNAASTESVDYPVVYRGYDKTEADEFGLKMAQMIKDLMGCKNTARTSTRKGQNGEYYGVLRGARAAGLTYYYIIEHGFHTNTQNTEWLLKDENLRLLAKKEAELIVSYFNIKKSEEVKKEESEKETTEKKYYRIRKSWNDAKSQLGAYENLEYAKKSWKTGYFIFDWNGNVVYPVQTENKTETKTEYTTGIYKVNVSDLNIRKGPGTNYEITGQIKDKGSYTITEIQNGSWGKLKSGAGWINVHKNYCSKKSTTTQNTVTTTTTTKKSNEEIAKEVVAGKWGNGTTRKQKLEAAGYNYSEIQKLVNKLLSK